jgi:antagonist of KipI
VHAGEEVEIAPGSRGYRAWMAISAGIDVPPVLGSRATDLRARFGGWEGRALRDGDTLPLRQRALAGEMPRVSPWSGPREWSQTASPYPMLRLLRGAEWTEFSDASRNLLFSQAFVVSPKCDRMGARLEGEPLQRRRPNERVSEPVAPGTIQVPDDGQPIILLGDCQTIGGYPRIGHVISVDLPPAAQLRPNDPVRFLEVTAREAALLDAERREELQRFRVGLKLRAR